MYNGKLSALASQSRHLLDLAISIWFPQNWAGKMNSQQRLLITFMRLLSGKENTTDSYIMNFGFETVASFFAEEEIEAAICQQELRLTINERFTAVSNLLKEKILNDEKFKELVIWLKKKNQATRYFETEQQIFVHAGIDEEAEEYWKVAQNERYLGSVYWDD